MSEVKGDKIICVLGNENCIASLISHIVVNFLTAQVYLSIQLRWPFPPLSCVGVKMDEITN